ncbi:MAG: M24 family metallopeptidase [bacterium]
MFEVNRERTERLQKNMKERGIDVFLILNLEDYYYFTGDVRRQPRALIPSEGGPFIFCFASEIEEAKRQTWIEDIRGYRGLHEMMLGIINFLGERGWEKPKIAVELDFSAPAFLIERFKSANPEATVVDARDIVSPLRKIKDEGEIERIRRAAELADFGMEVARRTIKPGVTELDVAAEVEYQMKKVGMERLSFPIFVNSGHRSLWLHGMATSKPIERGDLVLVDIGPVFQGYCGDITRIFSVGTPTEDQKKLYATYRGAQKGAIEELIKPGVAIHSVEETLQESFDGAGFGEYYLRGFIHGIGLGFEEMPFPTIFPQDVLESFETNMTLAVGHSVLSVPGIGGVRVEDTVLLKDTGCEYLTSFERDRIIEV